MADSSDHPQSRPSGPDQSPGRWDGQSPAAGEEAAPTNGTTETESRLSLDDVFDLLKNRRRRLVLRYLVDADEPSSLSELSAHVAAAENDKPVRALSTSERKRVYVGLYQGHLPRLDEADVVAFDAEDGTVTIGDTADQVLGYLNDDGGEPNGEPAQYVVVAVTGTVAFGVHQLLFPDPRLSTVLLGLYLGVFAYLAVEAAHRRGGSLISRRGVTGGPL